MTPTTLVGRLVALAYVVVVAAVATVGFASESTATILLAVALTLPMGIPGLVGYYVAYGLLALAPGANPDSSSGSMTCSVDGQCSGSSTGGLATWFVLTTGVVGVLALTVAAALNVLVVCWLWRSLRGSASASARTRSGA